MEVISSLQPTGGQVLYIYSSTPTDITGVYILPAFLLFHNIDLTD